MSNSSLSVRKAAVLGAGVMGAQIAAHFANADVPVVLFDLPAKEGDPNGIVQKGDRRPREARAGAARGAATARHGSTRRTTAATSRGSPSATSSSRRSPSASTGSATCTRRSRRTSRRMRSSRRTRRGCRSPRCRMRCRKRCGTRFCGVHFFNPPRYMHLVELIPAPATEPRAARRARGVPDDDARQGRDPREGHAELHRQPDRHVLDAGDDGAHARSRDWASTSSTR